MKVYLHSQSGFGLGLVGHAQKRSLLLSPGQLPSRAASLGPQVAFACHQQLYWLTVPF
jgi:hypothetical protein